MMNTLNLEEITRAYVTAALWSSTDDEGEPLDAFRDETCIEPNTLADMRQDVRDFLAQCESLLPRYIEAGGTSEQLGHDFWLTRNRHGAGFWDRGLGLLGQSLTDLSHQAGEAWLYIGDDGFIYQN